MAKNRKRGRSSAGDNMSAHSPVDRPFFLGGDAAAIVNQLSLEDQHRLHQIARRTRDCWSGVPTGKRIDAMKANFNRFGPFFDFEVIKSRIKSRHESSKSGLDVYMTAFLPEVGELVVEAKKAIVRAKASYLQRAEAFLAGTLAD